MPCGLMVAVGVGVFLVCRDCRGRVWQFLVLQLGSPASVKCMRGRRRWGVIQRCLLDALPFSHPGLCPVSPPALLGPLLPTYPFGMLGMLHMSRALGMCGGVSVLLPLLSSEEAAGMDHRQEGPDSSLRAACQPPPLI